MTAGGVRGEIPPTRRASRGDLPRKRERLSKPAFGRQALARVASFNNIAERPAKKGLRDADNGFTTGY
jgi:hypothetical protein